MFEKFEKKEFKFSDGGIIFCLAVVAPVILSIFILLIRAFAPNFTETDFGFYLMSTLSQLIMLFSVVFYCRYLKINIYDSVGIRKKLHFTQIILLVFLGLSMFAIMVPLQTIFIKFLEYFGYSVVNNFVPTIKGNVANYLISLVLAAALPAVCEETVFRGVITNASKSIGNLGAILLSAFLFTLIHGNPAQTLNPFIMGILLAWVMIYTESLIAPIILHFINNAITLTAEFINGEAVMSIMVANAWYFIGIGLLVAVLLIIGLIYATKKFGKRAIMTEDIERVNAIFKPTVDMKKDKIRSLIFYVPSIAICFMLWLSAFQGGV